MSFGHILQQTRIIRRISIRFLPIIRVLAGVNVGDYENGRDTEALERVSSAPMLLRNRVRTLLRYYLSMSFMVKKYWGKKC